MFRPITLLALLSALPIPAARAEVFCVSTAAQFRSALTDAAGSVSATEIRVREGFYSLPAANAQSISLQYSANSDLKISGGWTGASNTCTTQSGTADGTVLSASGVGRLFNVYLLSGAATQFEISTIGLWDGDNPSGGPAAAGCLTIETDGSSAATVRIDRNAFRLCSRASGSGSALQVTGRSATIYVRGNVFADNSSTSGAILLKGLGATTFYTSNNTVANNPQTGAGGGPGGMQITGLESDFHWFHNNVLWRNGTGTGYDLLVSAPVIVLNYNLIGEYAPLPASAVENNTLSTDPGFTAITNFHPRNDSPLRDNGGTPPGGALSLDFDGYARVAGSKIDRGAYEFSIVFADGFE